MECFFEQWLKGSPGIRLQQLASVLQKYQTFPQLYIYSESDHVVPHTSVEAFMEVTSKKAWLQLETLLLAKLCASHWRLCVCPLLCVSHTYTWTNDSISLHVLMCSCRKLPHTR